MVRFVTLHEVRGVRRNQKAGQHRMFSDELRRLLRVEVLKSACSADVASRHFGIHRRTLARHLAAEGTTFRRVADEVRFELAGEMLQNPSVSLSQVAAALKFSEASAFTRAFRRWTGQSPTAWLETQPPRAWVLERDART
jgi:AraC-like DNA-binding protein